MRKKQKDWAKDMAYERILLLFELAHKEFREHPERSSRYVELARRIGMRYRLRITKELKIQMCKNCCTFLVQGSNVRTRLHGTHVTTTCMVCGKVMRTPYR